MDKQIFVKIILYCMLINGLFISGCTKVTQEEKEEQLEPAVETIKQSPQLVGQLNIEERGKEELQKTLDAETPNEYEVLFIDDVEYSSHENDVYVYTWKIAFLEKKTNRVLGCDWAEVVWISSSNEIGAGLKPSCFNPISSNDSELEPEPNIEQPLPKIKYRLHSRSFTYGGYDEVTPYVELTSLEDHLEINEITINRGNCPVTLFSGQTKMGYGHTVDYRVGKPCKVGGIHEMAIHLTDGRIITTQIN